MTYPHEIERARLQEAVNHVWRHFITEGKPPGIDPLDDRFQVPGQESLPCVFQAPSGDRCAIGILMPSDADAPNILEHEGDINDLFNSAFDYEYDAFASLHGFTEQEEAWLTTWSPLRHQLDALQSCHDLAVQGHRTLKDDSYWLIDHAGFRDSLRTNLTEFCEMNDLTVPTD